MTKSLTSELPTLVGLRCWGVVAGVGNGSSATFHVGEQIARQPPLTNHHLSEKLRKFRGQYCVFVKGCAWQLAEGSRNLCESTDLESKIGSRLSELLTDRTITKLELPTGAGDLNIAFDDRYLMRLLCKRTTGENAIDNYAVRFPFGWLKVGADCSQSGVLIE